MDVVCLSEARPMSVTTPENRVLPRVPGPNSPASRLRQAAGRPRLDLPQTGQPHPSGDDDGLLVYWLRVNGILHRNSVVFAILF